MTNVHFDCTWMKVDLWSSFELDAVDSFLYLISDSEFIPLGLQKV